MMPHTEKGQQLGSQLSLCSVSGLLGRTGPQTRVPPPPLAHCLTAALGGPTSIPSLHPDALHPPTQTKGTFSETAVYTHMVFGSHNQCACILR